MLSAQLVDQGNGRFQLNGVLDFDSVPEVLAASKSLFSNYREIVLDLSGVTKVNSAGMALLLEWRCNAQKQSADLTIENLPENLRQIAQVCDVEALLVS